MNEEYLKWININTNFTALPSKLLYDPSGSNLAEWEKYPLKRHFLIPIVSISPDFLSTRCLRTNLSSWFRTFTARFKALKSRKCEAHHCGLLLCLRKAEYTRSNKFWIEINHWVMWCDRLLQLQTLPFHLHSLFCDLMVVERYDAQSEAKRLLESLRCSYRNVN